jgi:hypothetical protein
MLPLPDDIKHLRVIKRQLDTLMSDRYTSVEVRSNELYEYVIKDNTMNQVFPSQREFNQFLRKMHQDGSLKSIMPNYRVDTYNKNFYQWYFRRDVSRSDSIGQSEGIISNFKYKEESKKYKASNGELLRSKQELLIYEALLKCDFLQIFYDRPITEFGERKVVDFLIRNKHTGLSFIWEHFGMTNDEQYISSIKEKQDWFRDNGYCSINERGNLIYTYYISEKALNRKISQNILAIENMKVMTRDNLLGKN